MQIRDVWDELHPLFEGEAKHINEIDLINLRAGSMSTCIMALFHRAKECSCRLKMQGTGIEVMLPSPQAVIHHVLQGQITVAMWLTLPVLPMLSVYIDNRNTISFGYVRGMWNAMAVIAFFDLMYELIQLAPHSQLSPSKYTFTQSEREKLLDAWQDYNHANS